jgi:hypothetical protein
MLKHLVLSRVLILILILGIVKIKKFNLKLEDIYFAFTYHVVFAFAKTLPYIVYKFNIFLDNLFTNIKLFC